MSVKLFVAILELPINRVVLRGVNGPSVASPLGMGVFEGRVPADSSLDFFRRKLPVLAFTRPTSNARAGVILLLQEDGMALGSAPGIAVTSSADEEGEEEADKE